MNNDNKTTRELAIEWWDKISERAKILGIAVERNIDSKRAYKIWEACQGQITDAKIVEIYLTQHPTETESKENTYICLHCKSFFNPKPEICPECGHKTFEITHPSNNPLKSKGQEPEVDLLAHDNYPFGSTAELGSRERSLYEHKKESFIAGYNSLAEQNKLLREALEFVTDRLGTWINMGEWNETDQSAYDKAKNLLNQ